MEKLSRLEVLPEDETLPLTVRAKKAKVSFHLTLDETRLGFYQIKSYGHEKKNLNKLLTMFHSNFK